jgi:anti-sigma B factor antagonist
MIVKVSEYPNATILKIDGRLDSVSTPELEQQVVAHLDSGIKNLIWDFSELDYINSGGLRILVMSYKHLQEIGGKVMVCGARDYIAELFDISGYKRIFLMCSDLDTAMNNLQEH